MRRAREGQGREALVLPFTASFRPNLLFPNLCVFDGVKRMKGAVSWMVQSIYLFMDFPRSKLNYIEILPCVC